MKDHPWTYIIQAGPVGPVKIGKTADPWRRLGDLQHATHEPLTLRAMFPEDHMTELDLHVRFHTLRRRGEWFSPPLAFLGTLPSASHPAVAAYLDGAGACAAGLLLEECPFSGEGKDCWELGFAVEEEAQGGLADDVHDGDN